MAHERPHPVAGLAGVWSTLATRGRQVAFRILTKHGRSGEPEPSGVPVPRILAILAAWTLFVSMTLWGVIAYTTSQVPLRSPAQDVHAFAAPQLQSDPQGDLQRLRASQSRQLQIHAWIDRDKGLVRIPIRRAMAAIVARGQAGFDPLDPQAVDDARSRAVEAATRPVGAP